MAKQRVDQLLVIRGLADSRSAAQRLIMAGQVRADGELVAKPSQQFLETVELEVEAQPKYVSRGGEKLEAALNAFKLELKGAVCLDVGASTGGFTDCLLQHGAAKVYALDVGKGLLHWRLRQDARVVSIEGVNARYAFELPEQVDLATVDVSFISVTLILPTLAHLMHATGSLICLIKPQFEAGKEQVGKGGLVRDPAVHRQVLEKVATDMLAHGFSPQGLIPAPLAGPRKNQEFLMWCIRNGRAGEMEAIIRKALKAASRS